MRYVQSALAHKHEMTNLYQTVGKGKREGAIKKIA